MPKNRLIPGDLTAPGMIATIHHIRYLSDGSPICGEQSPFWRRVPRILPVGPWRYQRACHYCMKMVDLPGSEWGMP